MKNGMADQPNKKFDPRLDGIHEDRSLILDFLNAVYPGSLAEQKIIDVMMDIPEPSEPELTRRDMAYLAARGLLETHAATNPATGKKTKRWGLTAKGVNFVDRDKPWDELEDDF